MGIKGAVATGHPQTTAVAEHILKEGGNAFDAVVAAFFMACIAEPVLASLGGGGFLVAKTKDQKPFTLDFFVQTPAEKKPTAALDFEEIIVDFGSATQTFHMGNGTAAVPGSVKGIFEIHQHFCRMPITELVAPAVTAISKGIEISKEQANILKLVHPIYVNRQSARELFVKSHNGNVLELTQIYQNHELADTLQTLAIEGADLFYKGEIAQKIGQSANNHGGSIAPIDLANYQIFYRKPINYVLSNSQVFLNSPPSAGGMLIQFASELLMTQFKQKQSRENYICLLAEVMELTQQARIEALAKSPYQELEHAALFDPSNLAIYRQQIVSRHKANRGTTHISVADSQGNVAALTVSNGEGCGEILPGTGIMLNNMLGEDDLNPLGLNQWVANRRLSSMMCPGITINPERVVAFGSGGSNRIRTAILQVLLNENLLGFSLQKAIVAPRLHFDDELYLEAVGLQQGTLNALKKRYPDLKVFPEQNFYFGGVNAVLIADSHAEAAADPRRGGDAVIVR